MSDLLDDIVPADPARVEIADRGRMASLVHLAGDARLIPDLLTELRQLRAEHAQPNGHVGAYKHVCSGCGREFDSNRRQLPGNRSWCGRAECKKLAAADRARDYRNRKAKETP